jgi:large subunit ribosomal protein L21
MPYAIVNHGGKQYLAQEGEQIEVDRMPVEIGKVVEFDEILLVSDGKRVEVGLPHVSGARVKGTIVEHPNGKKIIVFKHHPKQRYRRTKGQRPRLTRIAIESVQIPGSAPAEPAPAAAPARKPAAKAPAKKAAAKKRAAKPSAAARKPAKKPKPTRAKK